MIRCPVEHRAPVISSRSDSKQFCPLHHGVGVAKENTGWNNTCLQSRNSDINFKSACSSPTAIGPLPSANEGHLFHMHPSQSGRTLHPPPWSMKY